MKAGAEVFEPTAPGDRLLFLQSNKRLTEVAQLISDFVHCTEANTSENDAMHASVLRTRKERVRELTRQLLADSMHLACHNQAHEGGRRDCAECRAELLPPLLDALACAAVDVRELGGDVIRGFDAAMEITGEQVGGIDRVNSGEVQTLKPLLDDQIVASACAAAGADARADSSVHARPGLRHLASAHAASGRIANFCSDLLDSVGDAERGASMGGVCGHVFREGEIVWTCRQCGVDDTCVMCEKCFRNSNHVGHDVRFHRSGGNGGCCDCGDFEAWAPSGCCPSHGGGDKSSGVGDAGDGGKGSKEEEDAVAAAAAAVGVQALQALRKHFPSLAIGVEAVASELVAHTVRTARRSCEAFNASASTLRALHELAAAERLQCWANPARAALPPREKFPRSATHTGPQCCPASLTCAARRAYKEADLFYKARPRSDPMPPLPSDPRHPLFVVRVHNDDVHTFEDVTELLQTQVLSLDGARVPIRPHKRDNALLRVFGGRSGARRKLAAMAFLPKPRTSTARSLTTAVDADGEAVVSSVAKRPAVNNIPSVEPAAVGAERALAQMRTLARGFKESGEEDWWIAERESGLTTSAPHTDDSDGSGEGYEIDAAKLREEARLKCAEAGTSGDLTPELLEDLDRLIRAQQNHERYASSGTPRDTQDDEAEEFSNDSFREDEAEALDYAIDEWRRHGASMGLLTSAVPVSHLTDEHVAVLALQWLKTTASRASGLLGIIAEALMQPTGAAVAPAPANPRSTDMTVPPATPVSDIASPLSSPGASGCASAGGERNKDVDVDTMSLRALKELLDDYKADYSKCIEKSEFRAMARKCLGVGSDNGAGRDVFDAESAALLRRSTPAAGGAVFALRAMHTVNTTATNVSRILGVHDDRGEHKEAWEKTVLRTLQNSDSHRKCLVELCTHLGGFDRPADNAASASTVTVPSDCMQVMLRLRATLSSAAPPPEFIGYVGKHNLTCSDIDISQRIASDLLRHHLASSSSTMLRNIMPDDTVFEELQRLTTTAGREAPWERSIGNDTHAREPEWWDRRHSRFIQMRSRFGARASKWNAQAEVNAERVIAGWACVRDRADTPCRMNFGDVTADAVIAACNAGDDEKLGTHLQSAIEHDMLETGGPTSRVQELLFVRDHAGVVRVGASLLYIAARGGSTGGAEAVQADDMQNETDGHVRCLHLLLTTARRFLSSDPADEASLVALLDIRTRRSCFSALFAAACEGRDRSTAALLCAGADVCARDESGRTPAWWPLWCAREDEEKGLCDLQGDPGEKARAQARGRRRCARLLWMASGSHTLRTEASVAWRAVMKDIVHGSSISQNLTSTTLDSSSCPGHNSAAAASSLHTLITCDAHLPRGMRSSFHELLLAALVGSGRFKSALGSVIVDKYRPVRMSYARGIGVSDEDVLGNLSVQLFTTPSLVRRHAVALTQNVGVAGPSDFMARIVRQDSSSAGVMISDADADMDAAERQALPPALRFRRYDPMLRELSYVLRTAHAATRAFVFGAIDAYRCDGSKGANARSAEQVLHDQLDGALTEESKSMALAWNWWLSAMSKNNDAELQTIAGNAQRSAAVGSDRDASHNVNCPTFSVESWYETGHFEDSSDFDGIGADVGATARKAAQAAAMAEGGTSLHDAPLERILLDALLPVQGAEPQLRRSPRRGHVQYESNEWLHGFNFCLRLNSTLEGVFGIFTSAIRNKSVSVDNDIDATQAAKAVVHAALHALHQWHFPFEARPSECITAENGQRAVGKTHWARAARVVLVNTGEAPALSLCSSLPETWDAKDAAAAAGAQSTFLVGCGDVQLQDDIGAWRVPKSSEKLVRLMSASVGGDSLLGPRFAMCEPPHVVAQSDRPLDEFQNPAALFGIDGADELRRSSPQMMDRVRGTGQWSIRRQKNAAGTSLLLPLHRFLASTVREIAALPVAACNVSPAAVLGCVIRDEALVWSRSAQAAGSLPKMEDNASVVPESARGPTARDIHRQLADMALLASTLIEMPLRALALEAQVIGAAMWRHSGHAAEQQCSNYAACTSRSGLCRALRDLDIMSLQVGAAVLVSCSSEKSDFSGPESSAEHCKMRSATGSDRFVRAVLHSMRVSSWFLALDAELTHGPFIEPAPDDAPGHGGKSWQEQVIQTAEVNVNARNGGDAGEQQSSNIGNVLRSTARAGVDFFQNNSWMARARDLLTRAPMEDSSGAAAEVSDDIEAAMQAAEDDAHTGKPSVFARAHVELFSCSQSLKKYFHDGRVWAPSRPQQIALAESALRVILYCVNELPPPASTESVGRQPLTPTAHALRRELIHTLCLGPAPFSELQRRRRFVALYRTHEDSNGTDERGEGSEAEFRRVVATIARPVRQTSCGQGGAFGSFGGSGGAMAWGGGSVAQSAAGSGGQRLVELRPELHTEYDPSFWHLTQQEHEKAREYVSLLAAREQRNGADVSSPSTGNTPVHSACPICPPPPPAHPHFAAPLRGGWLAGANAAKEWSGGRADRPAVIGVLHCTTTRLLVHAVLRREVLLRQCAFPGRPKGALRTNQMRRNVERDAKRRRVQPLAQADESHGKTKAVLAAVASAGADIESKRQDHDKSIECEAMAARLSIAYAVGAMPNDSLGTVRARAVAAQCRSGTALAYALHILTLQLHCCGEHCGTNAVDHSKTTGEGDDVIGMLPSSLRRPFFHALSSIDDLLPNPCSQHRSASTQPSWLDAVGSTLGLLWRLVQLDGRTSTGSQPNVTTADGGGNDADISTKQSIAWLLREIPRRDSTGSCTAIINALEQNGPWSDATDCEAEAGKTCDGDSRKSPSKSPLDSGAGGTASTNARRVRAREAAMRTMAKQQSAFSSRWAGELADMTSSSDEDGDASEIDAEEAKYGDAVIGSAKTSDETNMKSDSKSENEVGMDEEDEEAAVDLRSANCEEEEEGEPHGTECVLCREGFRSGISASSVHGSQADETNALGNDPLVLLTFVQRAVADDNDACKLSRVARAWSKCCECNADNEPEGDCVSKSDDMAFAAGVEERYRVPLPPLDLFPSLCKEIPSLKDVKPISLPVAAATPCRPLPDDECGASTAVNGSQKVNRPSVDRSDTGSEGLIRMRWATSDESPGPRDADDRFMHHSRQRHSAWVGAQEVLDAVNADDNRTIELALPPINDGGRGLPKERASAAALAAKDAIAADGAHGARTRITTCGHAMHLSCVHQYCASQLEQIERSRQNPFAARSEAATACDSRGRREFLCPLCRAVFNTTMPLLPPPKRGKLKQALAQSSDGDQDGSSTGCTSGIALKSLQAFNTARCDSAALGALALELKVRHTDVCSTESDGIDDARAVDSMDCSSDEDLITADSCDESQLASTALETVRAAQVPYCNLLEMLVTTGFPKTAGESSWQVALHGWPLHRKQSVLDAADEKGKGLPPEPARPSVQALGELVDWRRLHEPRALTARDLPRQGVTMAPEWRTSFRSLGACDQINAQCRELELLLSSLSTSIAALVQDAELAEAASNMGSHGVQARGGLTEITASAATESTAAAASEWAGLWDSDIRDEDEIEARDDAQHAGQRERRRVALAVGAARLRPLWRLLSLKVREIAFMRQKRLSDRKHAARSLPSSVQPEQDETGAASSQRSQALFHAAQYKRSASSDRGSNALDVFRECFGHDTNGSTDRWRHWHWVRRRRPRAPRPLLLEPHDALLNHLIRACVDISPCVLTAADTGRSGLCGRDRRATENALCAVAQMCSFAALTQVIMKLAALRSDAELPQMPGSDDDAQAHQGILAIERILARYNLLGDGLNPNATSSTAHVVGAVAPTLRRFDAVLRVAGVRSTRGGICGRLGVGLSLAGVGSEARPLHDERIGEHAAHALLAWLGSAATGGSSCTARAAASVTGVLDCISGWARDVAPTVVPLRAMIHNPLKRWLPAARARALALLPSPSLPPVLRLSPAEGSIDVAPTFVSLPHSFTELCGALAAELSRLQRLPKYPGAGSGTGGMASSSSSASNSLAGEEPALCLTCGEVMAAGKLVPDLKMGQCSAHALCCGGGVGMFFILSPCATLLSFFGRAAYYHSPYVDEWGEEDMKLNRGRPLYLSLPRLRALHALWRAHGVAQEVSRLRTGADRVIKTNYY